LIDFHLWRLGPGHLGAILCIATQQPQRNPAYYQSLLVRFHALSHVTVEVQHR
jgi:Co/Zn/Cd efflux system component